MSRSISLLSLSALLVAHAASGQSITVYPLAYPPPPIFSQPGVHLSKAEMAADPEFRGRTPVEQARISWLVTRANAALTANDEEALSSIQQEFNRPSLAGDLICGYVGDAATLADVTVSSEAISDYVTLARWLDPQPGGAVHTALFAESARRCITHDGMVVDGRTIIRVLPSSILVNGDGSVAYEALYSTNAAAGIVHRGAFLDLHFAFDIAASASAQERPSLNDAARDFTYDAQSHRLIPKQGVVSSDAPQQSRRLVPGNPFKSSSCNGKPQGPLTVRQKLGLDLPKGPCPPHQAAQ